MKPKPQIKLIHAFHHQKAVVKVVFEYNRSINEQLKKANLARWSSTMNSWYIVGDEFKLGQFFESMKEMALIDYSALKQNPTKPNN